MKIKELTYQNRRDFKAVFECEGCGFCMEKWGYDDANFHKNVIPAIQCTACGKSGIDIGADYRALTTKYPEGMQV